MDSRMSFESYKLSAKEAGWKTRKTCKKTKIAITIFKLILKMGKSRIYIAENQIRNKGGEHEYCILYE